MAMDRDAVWYIVSATPQGLQPWTDRMIAASRDRNVDVRWISHSPSAVAESPTLNLYHRLLGAPPDVEGHVRVRLEALLAEVDQRVTGTSLEDRWTIYGGSVPHPFMGFLSVPRRCAPQPLDRGAPPPHAPSGTYGFVYPYPMYIHTLGEAPGFVLESPGRNSGDVLDFYYRSMMWLFMNGLGDGALNVIRPLPRTVARPALESIEAF
jgi:hypothetical protein